MRSPSARSVLGASKDMECEKEQGPRLKEKGNQRVGGVPVLKHIR